MNEAHVAKVTVLERAKWTAELRKLLLQLEDTIAAIDHEQLVIDLALFILAVAEPVETVLHLAVPRAVTFPSQLLHIAKQIEPKIDAKRYL